MINTYVKNLYDFLETNEYFKETPQIDSKAEWLKIIRDECLINSISKTLDGILPNDMFLKLDNPDEYSKNDLLSMLYEQQFILVYSRYEKLKQILSIALNFKKIDLKRKNPTYGQIIYALKNKGLEDNIVNILDNELRNVIAHRTWYVEDEQFICTVNGKKKIISGKELLQRTNDLRQFSNEFYSLYLFYYVTPAGIKERKKKNN